MLKNGLKQWNRTVFNLLLVKYRQGRATNLRVHIAAPRTARDARDMPPLRVGILGRMRRDPDMPRNQRGISKRIETDAPAGLRLIRPGDLEKLNT